MKRLLVGAACAAAIVIGVQGTGWAAPINGRNTQTIVVQCDDDTVRISKPDSGASGWEVDDAGELRRVVRRRGVDRRGTALGV